MKKVAFRTTVLMLLLVALTVATMSGCSINRLVTGLAKSKLELARENPIEVVTQTARAEESLTTTQGLVTDTEAQTEPTTGVQQTTATKPTATKPAATKPPATKPPATKPPATKPAVTKPTPTKPKATNPSAPKPTPANVVITPLKHGVKRVETTTRFYDEKNGGYRNLINITFDRSGYRATTGDLLSEARANRNKHQSEIDIILKNVNSYRKDKGVAAVTLDHKLTEAAMVRACEMAWSDKHSHTRPNGTKYSSIFDDLGISRKASGENIAMGHGVQDVSKVWKDSPGHFNNMVNATFLKIGIGVAVDPRGCYYWCQLFMS